MRTTLPNDATPFEWLELLHNRQQKKDFYTQDCPKKILDFLHKCRLVGAGDGVTSEGIYFLTGK